MQVMFHLLPRLQAAQEQRAALGAIGPDLESITRFGAVIPEPVLDANDKAQLHLLQPNGQAELPPFYIERVLAHLDEQRDESNSLTAAERRTEALLKATAPHLEVLDFDGSGFRSVGKGVVLDRKQKRLHATRNDIFNTSLVHADHLARLLEMHMLDPIRHDQLDPDDPFVQTTLYVVAPFYEPLATAPIWPIVTQLMNRAGRRHISQVVGIFATGSYASDISRALEDGVTYAALRELELLAGLRTRAHDRGIDEPDLEMDRLTERVAESGSRLVDQIGDEIFDFVYLLDREKSNQSLTDDSHELAIQAGNALEAMIVAGGNLFIQEQLGLGIHHGEKRPYSLIGAASDYVPVSQILHAVNRQEESRLVRDWVLRSTPAPSSNPLQRQAAAPAPKSLNEFGFTTEKALAQLVVRHPDLYRNQKPKTIEDLKVPRTYILPDMVNKAMRRLSGNRWPATFADHLAELAGHLGLAAGPAAIDEAWGLDVDLAQASVEQSMDDRVYPQTVRQIQSHLTELVVASPSGLTAAERQVDLWKSVVDQERLWLLTRSTPSSRKLLDIRQEQAHRDWTASYARVANRTPSLVATMVRAILAIVLVTLLAMGYLWVIGGAWSWADDGIALAGFATGVLGAALAAFVFRSNRIQRLREQRVELAQDEFTDLLQRTTTDGMVRLVDRVLDLLNEWAQMLAEARQELHVLSTPPSMPAVPPPDVPLDYLYTPHMNEALWARALSYLREQIDAEGFRSEDRLDHLWGQPEWRQSDDAYVAFLAGQHAWRQCCESESARHSHRPVHPRDRARVGRSGQSGALPARPCRSHRRVRRSIQCRAYALALCR